MKTQLPKPSSGQPSAHQSTGPRTTHGKKRSRFNALKHGLYSKFVPLEGESIAEYLLLVNGLWDYWQPHGKMESLEVENLAAACWRKRRFFEVENGVIMQQILLPGSDEVEKQQFDAMELSRNAIASGGLLMHCYNNRFVIPDAIGTLKLLHALVEKFGFEENNRLVARLCGEPLEGEIPNGFRLVYETYAAYANSREKQADVSREPEYRKTMLAHIDNHINALTNLEVCLAAFERSRTWHKRCAGLIPGQGASDWLLRNETHFDRSIDRIAKRLERLQRIRKGQPLPPQVDVKIS